MKHIGLLSALGAAGAVFSMSSASLAAAAAPRPAPPPPVGVTAPQPVAPTIGTAPAAPATTERAVSYTGPNVPLMTTGLGLFGLSYVPSLIVGAQSNESADRNLYIPVAGPWMDLANRPSCGGRGPSCASEATNKVLLGASGVAQGAGAAMSLIGLLVPTKHETVTKTSAKHDGPTIRVSPASVGTGYGIGAVGTW